MDRTTQGGNAMADVQGTCDARFDGVRNALSASLDSGADVGASVAVYLHGEPVVDIWGGYVDEAKTRPGSATPSPTCGRPPRR